MSRIATCYSSEMKIGTLDAFGTFTKLGQLLLLLLLLKEVGNARLGESD